MSTISTTIKINDAFSGALDKLSGGLQRVQGGFDKLKNKISGGSDGGLFKPMLGANLVGNAVSTGMGMAGNGIKSIVGEMNEASKAWQTFEGNMLQLGKSPAEIASARKSMQQFAQQSIYSASDMSNTYSQLAAVGTKNVDQLVRGFGGLAAAATDPKQAMKTLSEQATQMAAKPKVQWQDFKLMLEQTPAGIAAVAKTMGMSTQDMIKNVQDGKIKTEEFLNAIAKTGTNANFSKMATQFKTVGEAVDGLTETLGNSLKPAFDRINKVGIKFVSDLTDQISKVNFNGMVDKLVQAANYMAPTFENIKLGISDFVDGFKKMDVMDHLSDTFHSIADAVYDLSKSFTDASGGNDLFKTLGKISGGTINAIADALSGLAKIIGSLDPDTLKQLGIAFMILKSSTKGLVLTAIVLALQQISKLDSDSIKKLAQALKILVLAIAGFKVLSSVVGMLKGFSTVIGALALGGGAILSLGKNFKALGGAKGILSGFWKALKGGNLKEWAKNMKNFGKTKNPKLSSPKMPKTPEAPDTGKPGKILSNAGAFLKLGGALLAVGAAVTLVAVGFKLLASAANDLASGGGATIAVFFGMLAAIVALVTLVRFLGPALIGGAVGFAIFAGALLLIGVAVLVASAGIALLATQLPTISEYGTSAAVGLLALAGAIAVFGLAAIIGAVGVLLLGVALVVLAVGLVAAGVGALIFAVGLALVGITALIAAVGVLLLGVAIALIAVTVVIAAVGMLLFGVALVLVAAMAMVAAVGLMMMSVALMMIMVTAMVSAVGLMLLAAALMMVGPMAMIAAVGLMLLAAAAIMLGAGLMVVAAAAMAVAAALVAVGASVMVMASLFVAAGSMMVSAITSAMSGVVSAVRSGISSAVSAARSFGSALVSVGRQLIQGLVNGIKSMIGAAVSAVQGVASKVVSAAKSVLHIGSPSRLFRQYGRWVDQGLIIGLNRDAGAAADASASMAQGVVDAASGMTPTLDPIGLSGMNPGDLLADGFNRALDAISNVAGAITGLDGSRANIGIFGQGAVSSAVGSDTVTSGSIAPNSVLTNNNSSSQTDNSTQVQIDKGAIVINASSNPDADVDKILDKIDQKIIDRRNKALGGG